MFWTYRGDPRMWVWLTHRVTGVGIFLFLLVHVIDTALIGWGPDLYNRIMALYHHPLFRVGEVLLVGMVLFHGINGLSIIVLELFPALTLRYRPFLAGVIGIFLLLYLPSAAIMISQMMSPSASHSFQNLPLKDSRPWLIALFPALAVFSLSAPTLPTLPYLYPRPVEKGMEFYGWLFMRFSGIALIFLAFGHLWIMHLVDGGVERINYQFVAERFATPFWRTYDLLLLLLAMGHGVWGMRSVLMDYVHHPIRRLLALWILYAVSAIILALGALILFTFQPHPQGS
ncbi:MAG: succinate dehydrogenase, cytochrome b556 subunit [Armatimonadetes bacterium]|nr:succinate dehydrogenase, cytochrome b556 subunit [Armatimonadota bacterium]MDW8120852.1 succinate dehydrogenase, cytochrome b556 subunit [Armatimonadota bacterium]